MRMCGPILLHKHSCSDQQCTLRIVCILWRLSCPQTILVTYLSYLSLALRVRYLRRGCSPALQACLVVPGEVGYATPATPRPQHHGDQLLPQRTHTSARRGSTFSFCKGSNSAQSLHCTRTVGRSAKIARDAFDSGLAASA